MLKTKESIEEITQQAVEMVKKLSTQPWENQQKFGYYSPCFKFTNENINDYSKYFQTNEQNVLTVCGSGDQVIAPIMTNAKNIDIFDSNLFTYFNVWLKIYAIKQLEYGEFARFYNTKPDKTRIALANKILKETPNDIATFWDKILSLPNDKFRFFFGPYDIDANASILPYLKPKNYQNLKDKLNNTKLNYEQGIIGSSKLEFACCDILEILSKYNKKYDFINLSNIMSYMNESEPFLKLLKQLIENNLNDEGSILINYLWNDRTPPFEIQELETYKIDLKEYYFKNKKYNDSVLVYTKKK